MLLIIFPRLFIIHFLCSSNVSDEDVDKFSEVLEVI